MVAWLGLLSGAASGSGNGSGSGMYSGQNSSSISTPVTTTQGGIGSQSFVFGGNPNVITAFQNPWILGGVALAVVVGIWLWKRK